MSNYTYRIIGVIGVLCSVILISIYSNIVLTLTSFIKEHISHDNHIEPEGIANIKKLISTVISVVTGFSILLVFNGFRKIAALIRLYIDVEKAQKIVFTNNLTTKINIQKRLFIVGAALAFVFPFFLPIINQPKSEGIIEEGSSMLFLIAGILLLMSSKHLNKNQFTLSTVKKGKVILFAISVLFIIMFGEEISWGQRLFGWESIGVFKDHNIQSETNIHNFFNPLFQTFYPILGLSLFISLFFIWVFPKEKSAYLTRLFFPHPSAFFLVFIMACLSFNGHSEIFEELLAIFCLLYSIRIFYSLKFPKVTS